MNHLLSKEKPGRRNRSVVGKSKVNGSSRPTRISMEDRIPKTTTPSPTEPKIHLGWDGNSSLRLYLKEAVEVPLLTPAQEMELSHRIQAGDASAREHMIKANLLLVVKIAREYEDYGLPLLDLINEGNIGLMRAVERFDPMKGAKLSTYAAWWIKQAIKRVLSNQVKMIRMPVHMGQQIFRLRRAENEFETRHGRPANNTDLAAMLNVSEEDIADWRERAQIRTTSLEAPFGNDPDSGCIADVAPDENVAMPWGNLGASTNAELMFDLISKLNPREQKIIRERFGLPHIAGEEPTESRTLEEIGVDLGLTRERIRQLEAAALRKIRTMYECREGQKNTPQMTRRYKQRKCRAKRS